MSGATKDYILLDVSKWRSACIGLSCEEEGLLIRICSFAWGAGKAPPSDVKNAARLIGVDWRSYRRLIKGLRSAGVVDDEGVPLPKFVRAAARLSGAMWLRTRLRIFARDGHQCRYCGGRDGALECDHLVPVSRGGSHSDENLVTSCRPCNRAKRDRVVSVEEWRAVRRARP